MHTCEFCKKEFETKSIINRHLTTARFCIELQKEKGVEVNEKFFKCEYCNKEVTSKNLLIYHRKICKKKQNYDEKDERIKKLEQEVVQLSHRIKDIENLRQSLLEMSIKINKSEKPVDTNSEKYKKVRVPKSMKMNVWYTYVGREVGLQKCMCCETHEITQGDFECAHVIAEKKGGPNTIENLRPICSTCNRSMRTMNLFEYKEKYHTKTQPVGF